jgi:PBP1b-binding outer membrane lipoprotein LpoB
LLGLQIIIIIIIIMIRCGCVRCNTGDKYDSAGEQTEEIITQEAVQNVKR